MSPPPTSIHPSSASPSTSPSPQLLTPNGTPPTDTSLYPSPAPFFTFSEARLSQLLSTLDHGTHSFDREDRDMDCTTIATTTIPENFRRLSFGDLLGGGNTKDVTGVEKRSSFLSGLTLSRPAFGFSSQLANGPSTQSTPSQSHSATPITSTFAQTHTEQIAQNKLSQNGPADSQHPLEAFDRITRPRSVPLNKPNIGPIQKPESQNSRGYTSPVLPLTSSSTVGSANGGAGQKSPVEVQKGFNKSPSYTGGQFRGGHFDPSKEPRLLSLL